MKGKFIAYTVLGLLVGLGQTGYADKEPRKFPMGCRDVGFNLNNGQLNLTVIEPDGLPQTLYLIHNKADYDVLLKNANQSKFLPTYEKVIPHDRWAAFARDVKQISFVCNSPDGQFLDCSQSLEICNYNNVKFPETNLGTYWITTTGSQQQAIHGSIDKGILLRW